MNALCISFCLIRVAKWRDDGVSEQISAELSKDAYT